MKKNFEEKREQRLKEISSLIKKRDEINARLNELTGLTEGGGENSLPPKDFPWMKEIEALFKEHSPLRIIEATSLMQKKFPQYKIERSKVHSVMAYLATPYKGILSKEEGRGLFSLKPRSPDNEGERVG